MQKILLTAIVLSIHSTFVFGQKSEEKAIRNVFETYRKAILTDNADVALQCVDSRTINYYGHILDQVKHADSVQVSALNVFDRFMVLTIRHRTPKEQILSFDGKSLLAYAIKSGMVGKNSVSEKNKIGEVTIESEFAKGQFMFEGKKVPIFFHFYKENGTWKLDLTSIFSLSTFVIEDMIKSSGMSENEYFFYLLKLITGREPNNNIWLPVQP